MRPAGMQARAQLGGWRLYGWKAASVLAFVARMPVIGTAVAR